MKHVCIHNEPKVFNNDEFELCQECTNELLSKLLKELSKVCVLIDKLNHFWNERKTDLFKEN